MTFVTSLYMALGLSMDAFAASIAEGARATRLRLGPALQLALTFALFQGAMPLVGWAVGQRFAEALQAVDHWVAFGLLGLIGGRMIYADVRPTERSSNHPPTGWRTVVVLAVATSVDALAVGFGLTFLASILIPVLVVGSVTFAMCLAGVHLGHRYRRLAEGKVQAIGGLILITIGAKILIEHLGLVG